MYKVRDDAAFVPYTLSTEEGEIPSRMPSAVAEEILARTEVRREDGRLVSGRMSFSESDFEEL